MYLMHFQALLESWRDWTGARHIYINFPDQLNLIKITLYHKQTIEDVNLFSYVVVVKCDGVTTKEKEVSELFQPAVDDNGPKR